MTDTKPYDWATEDAWDDPEPMPTPVNSGLDRARAAVEAARGGPAPVPFRGFA